jgi:hypothetical protein
VRLEGEKVVEYVAELGDTSPRAGRRLSAPRGCGAFGFLSCRAAAARLDTHEDKAPGDCRHAESADSHHERCLA